MQKIVYTKNYNGHKRGDIDFVCNNIAHGLIEKGVAMLYKMAPKSLLKYQDKMMRPEVIRKKPAKKDRRDKKNQIYRIKGE